MNDERDTDEQFGYRITKDGRVRVTFRGRQVVTVAGRPAERLSAQLGGAHGQQVQLLLAKATGNFKHGNEGDRGTRATGNPPR